MFIRHKIGQGETFSADLDTLIQRIRHAEKMAEQITTAEQLLSVLNQLSNPEAIKFLGNPYLRNNYRVTKNGYEHILVIAAGRLGDDAIFNFLCQTYPDFFRGSLEPLHAAIMHKRPSIVTTIVNKHVNLNLPDSLGQTPLFTAIRTADVASINLLLTNGADINHADNHGRTPLHLAAEKGNLQMLQLLLRNNANVNASDVNGLTPLNLAAKDKDSINAVKELLIYGANANLNPLGYVYKYSDFKEQNTHPLNDLINLYQKFQSIRYCCDPAFKSIDTLKNKLIDDHRQTLYAYIEVVAKLEIFLCGYIPKQQSRRDQQFALRSKMNALYEYINNPANADTAQQINQRIATFISETNILSTQIKQDHSAHGTLAFFGTKSRLASHIEEAITPALGLAPRG